MTWGGGVEFDETEHLNQLAHGEPVEPRCLPRQCFNMQSFDRLRMSEWYLTSDFEISSSMFGTYGLGHCEVT
jgi:hypothetical protein